MPVTQEKLNALKTTLIARWNAGLAMSPDDWKIIAKLVRSNSKSNTYKWLSQFPAFRKWVGARLHKAYAEHGYIVMNDKYEATVDVERTDIEDDDIGQYGTIAEGAGQAATDLKNDLIFQALADGFASECYDGQYFFDEDHPVYPNEDGTGTAVSVSNMQAGTGAPWVLLCTRRAAAPIYLQERIVAEFVAKTSAANSDTVFEQDLYSYGGRWRGNAAYGFWQCAFGSKATLNAANFEAAYAAMMDFVCDGNRKLGIKPDLLVCGSANMSAAEKLLLAQTLDGGASNTHYKVVALHITPWM